ncbi:MAG: ATP-binding cassette domain-containing protein, partial [Pontibacterium sp.]
VSILGTPIETLSAQQRDRFRAENMGIIFQQFNLLPYLNLVENVALACRFSKIRQQRVEAAGKTLAQETERLLSALELGGELLLRPVSSLSVGQQQRVAVARALLGAPPIVIADEPTSALDLPMRDRFLDLLFEMCAQQNTTLIFVSHDATIADRFTRHISLTNINHLCGAVSKESCNVVD